VDKGNGVFLIADALQNEKRKQKNQRADLAQLGELETLFQGCG
jgi:hypothetical protein